MTDEMIHAKLSGIRCFLLDMDGTFYLGDRIIPGGLEFLDALEKTGRTARFLTNNSSRSASTYAEKLARMGVPAAYRDVITSGQAAARYCLTHFPGKTGYLLGNPVLRAELTAMGLRFCDSDDADYVLAAFDTTLDYGNSAASATSSARASRISRRILISTARPSMGSSPTLARLWH